MDKKTLIIIPAFNEEETIARVIESLAECNNSWDILVVNDCSTDETSLKAKQTGKAQVIDLPCNLGVGGAVQTGLMFAQQHDYALAIKFDGDGQHIATEIESLVAPIVQGTTDVTIGSRFCQPHKDLSSTLYRRIGIKIFEIVNYLLIGQRITDNTSGFRAYNRRAIEFFAKHYPSFDYPEPEEVILLGKNNFQFQEVFVPMRERQGGKSSIYGFRTVYYMIKVLLSVIMVALRPPKKKV
jgi:glycosyltransferase involved in cell wall biosynthesis